MATPTQNAASFFTLTVAGGPAIANFTELSGMDAECEAIEHRESNNNLTGYNTIRKIPGTWKYSDVTIKRAIDNLGMLYQWIVSAQSGTFTPGDATITMYDTFGQPVQVYVLKAAWPKKYSPAALNAKENSVAIEEVVIAHEGFELQGKPRVR